MEQQAFKKHHGNPKHKKEETFGEGDPFSVIINDFNTAQYVSGYNRQTHTVLFSTDFNEAVWSYDSAKVDQYIDHNDIDNVTRTEPGGNHPTKPGLP